jgi:hypothetical protein
MYDPESHFSPILSISTFILRSCPGFSTRFRPGSRHKPGPPTQRRWAHAVRDALGGDDHVDWGVSADEGHDDPNAPVPLHRGSAVSAERGVMIHYRGDRGNWTRNPIDGHAPCDDEHWTTWMIQFQVQGEHCCSPRKAVVGADDQTHNPSALESAAYISLPSWARLAMVATAYTAGRHSSGVADAVVAPAKTCAPGDSAEMAAEHGDVAGCDAAADSRVRTVRKWSESWRKLQELLLGVDSDTDSNARCDLHARSSHSCRSLDSSGGALTHHRPRYGPRWKRSSRESREAPGSQVGTAACCATTTTRWAETSVD